jgi:hypothetical protein
MASEFTLYGLVGRVVRIIMVGGNEYFGMVRWVKSNIIVLDPTDNEFDQEAPPEYKIKQPAQVLVFVSAIGSVELVYGKLVKNDEASTEE